MDMGQGRPWAQRVKVMWPSVRQAVCRGGKRAQTAPKKRTAFGNGAWLRHQGMPRGWDGTGAVHPMEAVAMHARSRHPPQTPRLGHARPAAHLMARNKAGGDSGVAHLVARHASGARRAAIVDNPPCVFHFFV